MASSILTEFAGAAAPLSPGLPPPPVHVGDESLYEVVNGERRELPPMGAYSSWIASRLDHRLGPFTEERSLGTSVTETLFVLDRERDLRRRPDVAFVSAERWPLDRPIPRTGDWEVMPDLAVEVVSPHDVAIDLLAKVREYFAYGARLVWVVYPQERQVYVYTSPTQVQVVKDTEELEGGEVLPGFRVALPKLFGPPVPSPSRT